MGEGILVKKFFYLITLLLALTLPSEVYSQDFTENLEKDDEIILVFSASWCGPCKILKRRLTTEKALIEIIEEKYDGHLYILDAESEEYSSLARRFRVRSYPTIIHAIYESENLIVKRRWVGSNLSYEWLENNSN